MNLQRSPTTPLFAQTVDNNGRYVLLTGQLLGKGGGEACFVWDNIDQRLCVYFVLGNTMEMIFMRNCEYDFNLKAGSAVGKQKPTSEAVKRDIGKKAKSTAGSPFSGRPKFTLAVGQNQAGNQDLIWILNEDTRRMNTYSIKGDTLSLLFSRNIDYDLAIPGSMGKTDPPIEEMKKLGKKGS